MTTFQPGIINRTVAIHAPVPLVWNALTDHNLMAQWMSDSPIQIITDWKVDGPIVIKGDLHNIPFENTGTVLKYEPGKALQYTHLSSLSHLSGNSEDFCRIEFHLTAKESQTILILTISNFPTESIFKHMDFYWRTTIGLLKKMVEENNNCMD